MDVATFQSILTVHYNGLSLQTGATGVDVPQELIEQCFKKAKQTKLKCKPLLLPLTMHGCNTLLKTYVC